LAIYLWKCVLSAANSTGWNRSIRRCIAVMSTEKVEVRCHWMALLVMRTYTGLQSQEITPTSAAGRTALPLSRSNFLTVHLLSTTSACPLELCSAMYTFQVNPQVLVQFRQSISRHFTACNINYIICDLFLAQLIRLFFFFNLVAVRLTIL